METIKELTKKEAYNLQQYFVVYGINVYSQSYYCKKFYFANETDAQQFCLETARKHPRTRQLKSKRNKVWQVTKHTFANGQIGFTEYQYLIY